MLHFISSVIRIIFVSWFVYFFLMQLLLFIVSSFPVLRVGFLVFG